ncbi:MAG: class I tRNA ligase family protein [Rhizomicrobium sp.]
MLDPIDLIEPRSAVSGARDVEIRDSQHLFLKQTDFVEQLRAWIAGHRHDWPVLATSIANKWLDEGLQDRGITRDLDWGLPVPDDIADGQLKGKVFYVWFDAPIEYIAASKEWADKNGLDDDAWRRWWIGDAARDVSYVEFMGKDNVPFHSHHLPRDDHGHRRAVAQGRPAEGVQLHQLRRRQVLDLGQARHLHGYGAGDPAGRLLALLPDGERAGELGQQFHLGPSGGRPSTRTWPTCWAISSTG